MADSFDSNAPAAVTYTIDTQSYGDLTVLVYASGSAVADCVLDTTGPGGSGFDYPATDGSDPASTDSDSCTVTSTDGLFVVVENNAYITYYGAVFGYNTPNIDISVDGASVASESATYTWYTATNSGNTVDVYIDLPAIDGVWLDYDDDDDGYSDADEDTNCVGDGRGGAREAEHHADQRRQAPEVAGEASLPALPSPPPARPPLRHARRRP